MPLPPNLDGLVVDVHAERDARVERRPRLVGRVHVGDVGRREVAGLAVEARREAAVADGLGADELGVLRARQRQLLGDVLAGGRGGGGI
jgi:hypothetical protein